MRPYTRPIIRPYTVTGPCDFLNTDQKLKHIILGFSASLSLITSHCSRKEPASSPEGGEGTQTRHETAAEIEPTAFRALRFV